MMFHPICGVVGDFQRVGRVEKTFQEQGCGSTGSRSWWACLPAREGRPSSVRLSAPSRDSHTGVPAPRIAGGMQLRRPQWCGISAGRETSAGKEKRPG